MSAAIDGDCGFDGSAEPAHCYYCDEPAEPGRLLVTYSDGSTESVTTLMHADCFAEMAQASPCHDGYDDPEEHPEADDYADRAWDVPR